MTLGRNQSEISAEVSDAGAKSGAILAAVRGSRIVTYKIFKDYNAIFAKKRIDLPCGNEANERV